jgi:hypothetical protein
MVGETQTDLLSEIDDLHLARILIADLHDDLQGKVSRFRQLSDLSAALGQYGTMLPGGETAYAAWLEARASFVHGNYIATVMLCQGLAEHMLAAQLTLGLQGEKLPKRVTFTKTLELCIERGVVTTELAKDLERLMELRNPLSHFRDIDDPSNLSRRTLTTREPAQAHLFSDASFAIGTAVRLLALPHFRIDQ